VKSKVKHHAFLVANAIEDDEMMFLQIENVVITLHYYPVSILGMVVLVGCVTE
jgi:hypothetical protein